ncbi:hypothetical protein [Chondromyces crocatus]|uniref:Uncharacterized protein n=1 Tax=Chondromyces crocatus TaxID=52 RepID=A0A0K1E6A3_CHOCO|nr:hypothetical protein [Chondromyces crocatus]AKT36078.1 uncharacterized protein CMC5_001910 [Chondromyces crocatus]
MLKKTVALAALLATSLTGSALAESYYDLAISAPKAKANAESVVTVKVTSKGDTHINKKYPTRLTVNPPEGVSVKKTRQTATDAVKLSDSTLEFQVAFEADEPGTKTIKGELRFATCKGEESCQQYTKRISFDVDVK